MEQPLSGPASLRPSAVPQGGQASTSTRARLCALIASIDAFLRTAVQAAVVLAYSAMVVIGALQVVARYILKTSFIWTDESVRFIYVWSVLLTAALIFDRGSQIKVDLLHGWYPAPVRHLMDAISEVLTTVFIVALGVFGAQFVQLTAATNTRSTSMELPMALVYSAFPLTAALMLWFQLSHLWRRRRGAVAKP